MKALGSKSISAGLTKVINIAWWLAWIAYIIVIVAVIAAALFKKEYTASVPVSWSNIAIRQVLPSNTSFPSATLNATSGNLYLNLAASWGSVIMLMAAFTLIFAAVLAIMYQLKMIFSIFSSNLPFNQVNVSRIRNIAYVLMACSAVQWIYVIVANQILQSNLQWGDVHLTYSFNFSYLVTGVVLLIVSEIFKLGSLLEEDVNLTI